MADYFGFEILYRTPFGPEPLRAVCDALQTATAANWAPAHTAGGAADGGLVRDAVERWLETATPDRMHRVPEDLPDETTESYTDGFFFAFSPFTEYGATLSATREKDGTLGVALEVCDGARFLPSPIPVGRDGDAWPLNRWCLLRILDALTAALPTRQVKVDEPLRESSGATGEVSTKVDDRLP
jgi:hypothetical protein